MSMYSPLDSKMHPFEHPHRSSQRDLISALARNPIAILLPLPTMKNLGNEVTRRTSAFFAAIRALFQPFQAQDSKLQLVLGVHYNSKDFHPFLCAIAASL